MTGKQIFGLISVLVIACSCGIANKNGKTQQKQKLVWSDEFDYNGRPDSTKWIYEVGYLRNVEDQFYTDNLKNVRVENGNLIIEADKEAVENPVFIAKDHKNWKHNRKESKYTAGSIATKGKASWKYGKIEVKAKLPEGVGLWPAIWMLGDNHPKVRWPQCGEIDIMEHVGFNADTIFGTIHTGAYNHMKGTHKGKKIFIEKPYSEYHIYAIDWTPEKIDFLLDNKVYFTIENEHKTEAEWPFDQSFHLKLNIAVGGMLGGKKGIDDSVFSAKNDH